MKRYIKASISTSAPDWLKRRLTSKYSPLREALVDKKGLALDRAEFINKRMSDTVTPIYLIECDYGDAVYIPGVNDKDTITLNNRNRQLGSIAKSKLHDLAIDTVYVDMNDPANMVPKKDRYQDPRYTYRYNRQGRYAGQYKRRNYLGNGEYGEGEWSTSGAVPSNESRARDKSGYKIPSPAQRIQEYYTKFPERITDKIDALYDRLVEVRSELMDMDFNSPVENYHDDVQFAYRRFSDAINEYRSLLGMLDENRQLKRTRRDEWALSELSKSIRNIQSMLDEVEDSIS